MTTLTTTRSRRAERTALLVAAAFGLGVVLTVCWQDDARQQERHVLRELTQIAVACAPLLTVPAGSTPELIPAATASQEAAP
ncbi:MAG: hypothetical protein LCH73_02750 [Proteobacteria bacterium]|nr:hypothetical protein [Pseudomonadota bacterium]